MKRIFVLIALISMLFTSCFKDHDDKSSIETACEVVSEVISDEDFREINTSYYGITAIQLNGDCLEVTISTSGCDPEQWELNLYSVDSFYNVYPLQRTVKIELINNQECLAVFQKTVSFDLGPFQLHAQNELPLNIEGWNEQIIYKY